MNVFGKVVDAQNTVVQFATVYVSDAKGSPVTPNRSTSTDTAGMYKLDNVNNTDFITVRMVGLTPLTLPVSKVVKVPLLNSIGNDPISLPTLNFVMKQDPINDLKEIEVVADKVIKKDNTWRNVLIVSSFLLLVGGIVYTAGKGKAVALAVKK